MRYLEVLGMGFVLVTAACVVAEPVEEVEPPAFVRGTAQPRASGAVGHWSEHFTSEVVLVGNRIRIEGPDDLLSALAVMQAPGVLQSSTKTTPEGLLQKVTVGPDGGGTVIRAQLLGWSIAALQSIVVLQRPDDGPVRILVEGDASWIPVSGVGERRGARLEFRSDDPVR